MNTLMENNAENMQFLWIAILLWDIRLVASFDSVFKTDAQIILD